MTYIVLEKNKIMLKQHRIVSEAGKCYTSVVVVVPAGLVELREGAVVVRSKVLGWRVSIVGSRQLGVQVGIGSRWYHQSGRAR